MPSWRTMSATQKIFTVTGFTVIAALLLYWLLGPKRPPTDPPIIVGDGSIIFRADKIKKTSNNELDVLKALHKVGSVVVADPNGNPTSMPIPLKGETWTLTSASGAVVLTNDSQLVQDEVKGNCSIGWQPYGMDYKCDPADGSKFTPATLTITSQDCPTTGQPTCTLTCVSGKCQAPLVCANGANGKCQVQLSYKSILP